MQKAVEIIIERKSYFIIGFTIVVPDFQQVVAKFIALESVLRLVILV